MTYLGDLEIDQGHLREAEMMYGKARTLSKTLGDRAKEAIALHGLGVLKRQSSQYAAAQKLLDQALDLFKTIHHIEGQACALLEKCHFTKVREGKVERNTLK